MGTLLDEYIDDQRWHREIVDGVIASVNPRSILIDIGGKSDALVHPRELGACRRRIYGRSGPGRTSAST